jgi:hypothetical protein
MAFFVGATMINLLSGEKVNTMLFGWVLCRAGGCEGRGRKG